MNRRKTITLLGGAAAWPLAARAQQPTMPVIGFLNSSSAGPFADRLRAFHQGLNEIGYVEGRNVAVEYRWANDQNDRLPALATDLVGRQVSVIASAGGVPAARAAKAATTTIPIVFNVGVDPVEAGLVASLSRPGANLTGVTTLSVELGPKQLELLHALVPTAPSIAVLLNPTNAFVTEAQSKGLGAAARTLGLQLHILQASNENDFDAAFAILTDVRAGALVIGPDALFIGRSQRLAALALRHGVPTIFQNREFADAGGLMSYGGSTKDNIRLVGVYAGRILKGDKPGDLPVQQSTKVELVLNLKTARALGVPVPLTLRARADEVIE